MNFAQIARVFRKEVRETMRDRRTMIVVFAVPLLVYPLLIIGFQQLVLFGLGQLEEAPVTVAAQGAPAEMLAFLAADSAIDVREEGAVDQAAVAAGEIDAGLLMRPAAPDALLTVEILYDGSRDRSNRALAVLTDRLEAYEDTVVASRVRERGLSAGFINPVEVRDTSVASAQRMAGYRLGPFIPMILILMTVIGAFFPAVDLTAGEKERGTLETLMTSPVPPREVVLGKFFTVLFIALLVASLNLLAMGLTLRVVASQLSQAGEGRSSLEIGLGILLLVLLLMVPVAVFFSALSMGIAVRAQTFKEAQNLLAPVQFGSFLPAYLPLVPGIELSYGLAMVPVVGLAMLYREMLAGVAAVGPAIVAVSSTVIGAALALAFAIRSFGREEVLFGTGSDTAVVSRRGWGERFREWRSRRNAGVPKAGEALLFAGLLAVLFFYAAPLVFGGMGERGQMLAQIFLIAGPAVLLTWLGRFSFRDTLALRMPAARAWPAAVLIALGVLPVSALFAWAQSLFMDLPEEFVEMMEELVVAQSPEEVLGVVLLVAVTPAICEELAMRGFLLQGLLNGMSARRAILVSALIFGTFHLSPMTLIRILPTAWLGLVLGYVAWRTRSLFPGMLMHFINNGIIVLALAFPDEVGRFFPEEEVPAWWLILAAIVCLLVGYRLLPRRPEPVSRDPAG